MSVPGYVAFPLLAGLLFALSAIFLKRVVDGGLGPWRLMVVNAWAMAICFSPLWLLPAEPVRLIPWWQLLISGALSFTGNLLMLLAFSRGDVSVATPIMGTKVILVALLTVWLLNESVPLRWWIAAFMSAGGIALLRPARSGVAAQRHSQTVALAIGSSVTFSLADVLVQKWATPPVFNRYLPLTFLVSAIFSLALIPFFRQPLTAIPRPLWRPLLIGCGVLSAQAWLIFYALSQYGRATAVNVVYGARGIWSVLLVWLAGRWLGSTEDTPGHGAMLRRLAGAAVLLVAVVIVTL